MSEDANTQFVNKYIQILKSKFDGLQNELLNMEVQNAFLRASLAERNDQILALSEKLESSTVKKTTRASKPQQEKGE